MSGGSFNYLYCKEVTDLMNSASDLEEMSEILTREGYEDVARDMRRLIEYIKSAQIRIGVLAEQLRDIMKAVEWYEDCDIGKETLNTKIEAYRQR
ncbi:MAG: hypothetical protein ILN61_00225 [Lachnospiraceae bacterium]|nr:hypothetical protein [Lachnospiraceae bacterium]